MTRETEKAGDVKSYRLSQAFCTTTNLYQQIMIHQILPLKGSRQLMHLHLHLQLDKRLITSCW